MTDLAAEMPDTLSPEQAKRMGFIGDKPAPASLPDTLTPEEAKRAGLIGGKAQPADHGVVDAAAREFGNVFGLGPAISAGLETAVSKIPLVGPKFLGDAGYTQRRDLYQRMLDEGRAAHPWATAGAGLGRAAVETMLVPGSAALTPAKAGALFGAAEGAGESVSRGEDLPTALVRSGTGAVAGGLGGKLIETGGKAVTRLAEGAQERVLKRLPGDVTRGETAAKARTANKVVERAGDEGEGLRDLMKREPELEKALATTAESSPKKAVKVVSETSERFTGELDDIYREMEKAGRVVSPTDIAVSFDKLLADKLKTGDLVSVGALRKVRSQFLDEYGKFGHLGADTMRGLKKTAGQAAFAGDPAAPANVKAQVQRDVWGVFADAIERQAQNTPGVDVARLKTLNRDMSQLIPIEQALTERAAGKSRGSMSIVEMGKHAALSSGAAALGFAHGGGAEAALFGMMAPVAAKVGKAAVRHADYGLSRLAQRGLSPEAVEGTGARAASIEFAARVSEGMRGGQSLQEAIDAAEKP